MKEELTLKYTDGCFIDTYTYQCMKELKDEVEKLREKLERARDIDTTFQRWLQDHKEMTYEQFYCYISWCKHTNLSPTIIMEKYVFPKVE